ncbi:hypothetical protein [Treponema primitia]|uniref:hypothetical protein n=1 Tax=Treponema primitia TaxID=88058 RepID=UPI000255548D|nr:hypothetical protein [Treponema primitia]
MKRLAVLIVIFGIAFNAVYAQNINKTQYKEISLADYKAAGDVKERDDTERFKLNVKFLLQAANSVAVQDTEDKLQRFESEKTLGFERGQELVLYVHSTHLPDGGWETEIIDLAEKKE